MGKDTMDYVSILPATLHRLIKRNVFPFIKIEKCALFRNRDINSYLEALLIKAPANNK